MSARTIAAIDVGALRVRVQGIPGEVVREALEGLEAELLRRLGVRGVDALVLGELAPAQRLSLAPLTGEGLQAAALRAAIAARLLDLLAPAQRPSAGDTEE